MTTRGLGSGAERRQERDQDRGGTSPVSESSLSEELDSLVLSDSDDEKPFSFEEPAVTSTFSAAIKPQGLHEAGPAPRAALAQAHSSACREGQGALRPMSPRAAPNGQLRSAQIPDRPTFPSGKMLAYCPLAKQLAYVGILSPPPPISQNPLCRVQQD